MLTHTSRLVADILLLGAILFPGDPWYESSVQSIAERITMDTFKLSDMRMMSMLSKKSFEARKFSNEYIGGHSLAANSQRKLLTHFLPEEVGEMSIPLSLETEPPRNLPHSPVISLDSKNDLIVASTCDGRVRLYENQAHQNGSRLGNQLLSIKQRAGHNIVRFNVDASKFFLASDKIQMWDTKSCKSNYKIEIDNIPSCICVYESNAKKNNFILGDDKGCCELWDQLSSSSASALSFKGHSATVSKISCMENEENMFVSSSRDGRVLVWDMRKQEEPLHNFHGHHSWIADHQIFHANSVPFVACSSHDWTSTVWNLETGALSCILDGHTSPIQTLSICSDGGQSGVSIATGDRCSNIHFWQPVLDEDEDSRYGKILSSLNVCSDPVLGVGYQADKSFVACYANSTIVSLDPVNEGVSQCKSYYSTSQSFTACKIDPLMEFVYTGCANGDVHSWNSKTTNIL